MEHFIDIQSPPPKITHKEEEEERKEEEDEEGEIRSSPYHNSGLVTDIQVQSRNSGPKSSGKPNNSGLWFSPLIFFSFSLCIGYKRFGQ